MRGLVFGVGLAVIVAAPALGQGLPPVPTPSLPAVPTVVPSLPTPPALPAPTLPSVPSAPSVPHLPSVPSVPSVPGVGSPGGSSQNITPTGGGSGAAAGRVSGGGSGGGSRAAAGGSRSGGSGATASAAPAGAASGRQGGSSSATAGTAQRSADPRARAVARRDRRLRARVRRFEGCIGALPRSERRVLTLRAGLGGERPQTRRRVARTLQLSTRRVRRLEHRGIRRLGGLVRAGHCSTGEDGDVGGGTIPADQAAALGGLAGAGLGAGTVGLIAARALGGGTPPDRVEVKGERESSGGTTRQPGPTDAGAGPLKPRPPGAILERGGRDVTLPLLLLAMAAALVIAVRAAGRADPPA